MDTGGFTGIMPGGNCPGLARSGSRGGNPGRTGGNSFGGEISPSLVGLEDLKM